MPNVKKQMRMALAEEVAEEVRDSEANGTILTRKQARKHGLTVVTVDELQESLRGERVDRILLRIATRNIKRMLT